MTSDRSKRLVLTVCLFLGPLFQLTGDVLWKMHTYSYSWNVWREASYIFFIPAGFLFAKIIERKSLNWAMISCALFVIGCIGCVAMMPLFRLGAFYPTEGNNAFPIIVNSVLDKKSFAATLYPPGLCFPVSLVVFGICFLKYKMFSPIVNSAFILSGILFWLGNAGEIDSILIIGDGLLLCIFCFIGYLMFGRNNINSYMRQPIGRLNTGSSE